jgi:hypothetical protein
MISGRRRGFRDGGDSEADRPAGPRRAWDSWHGGRPRRWESTRGCWSGGGRCRRDSRHAHRGERERWWLGFEGGVAELGWTVLKIRTIY